MKYQIVFKATMAATVEAESKKTATSRALMLLGKSRLKPDWDLWLVESVEEVDEGEAVTS